MRYLEDINEKKQKRQVQARQDYEVNKIVSAGKESAKKIVDAVNKTHDVRVVNQQKVEVKHNIDFKPVLQGLTSLKNAIDGVPSKILIPENEKTESVKVTNLKDYSPQIGELLSAIKAIELAPNINVKTPEVKVNTPTLDIKPLENKITELSKSLETSINNIRLETEFDISPLQTAMNSVKNAINSLEFPVANYVLPFKDVEGRATQVQLDSGGNLPVSASISGADGAITDGVTASIRATVKESNSDAGNFGLVVINPDGSTISGGGGGGDVNLTEVLGTATAVNTGNADAGTQRVVLATNQPTVDVDTGLTQPTTPSDTQPISATSLPLPTGASTSALQTTANGLLTTIDTDTGTIATNTSTIAGAVSGTEMQVDIVSGAQTDALTDTELRATPVPVSGTFYQTTQPVSAASLPLPSGAATSANQSTTNSSLSTIINNTTRPTVVSERVSNTDGTSTAFSNFGATASTYNYVYAISAFRTDTGTTPIYIDFRNGTGGTILFSIVLPAGGGAVMANDYTSPLFRTSTNTALAYDVSDAISTVYISVSGFRAIS